MRRNTPMSSLVHRWDSYCRILPNYVVQNKDPHHSASAIVLVRRIYVRLITFTRDAHDSHIHDILTTINIKRLSRGTESVYEIFYGNFYENLLRYKITVGILKTHSRLANVYKKSRSKYTFTRDAHDLYFITFIFFNDDYIKHLSERNLFKSVYKIFYEKSVIV